MRYPPAIYKATILFLALAGGAFAQGVTVTGMGYLYPSPVAVAPGQLITVFLAGNVQGDISATIQNLNAPIVEVSPAQSCSPTPCATATAVTIQIPYDFGPSCMFTNPACLLALPAQLTVTVNGVAGTPFDLTPQADAVHLLTSCDTVVPGGSGMAPMNGLPCAPLITHTNGSLVSAASPAAGGEVLVAYAVGLGLTNPLATTGQPATGAVPTANQFVLDFNFRPNALATKPLTPAPLPTNLTPLYTGLTPGYVGLYQINFVVPQPPAGLMGCNGTVLTNLTVSLGGVSSFDGAGICVVPMN